MQWNNKNDYQGGVLAERISAEILLIVHISRKISSYTICQNTKLGVFIFSRYQIMKNCWRNEPQARPSFTALTKQLKDMENQHKVRSVSEITTQRLVFFILQFKIDARAGSNTFV